MKIVLAKTPDVENKGKYNQLNVSYQSDGQDKEKKIMSFTYKDVYETLMKGQAGDAFEIKLVKDDKYWNWTEAKSLGREAVPESSSSGGGVMKRTGGWETPEERAVKQVYIVRQSSISNAIAMGAKKAEDVIALAKQFEAYVFSSDPVEVEKPDLKDVV